MNKFWSLFRMQLNVQFGFTALKHRYLVQRKRLWEPVLILVALFSLYPAAKRYWGFLSELFYALSFADQEFLLVAAGLMVGQLAVLILGLFYVMSAFYYSQDLDRLIPLPISPGTIVGAKFAVVLVSEWVTLIPITLPFLLVVGVRGGHGIGYWLRAGLAYGFAPVIPLALAAVLAMFIARVTNLPRKREFFRVVAGVIAVVTALGINLYINTRLTTNPQAVQALLSQSQGLLELVARRFPPAAWLTQAVAGQGLLAGWGPLAAFGAASCLAIWALSEFAQGLFLSGYLEPSGKAERQVGKPRRVLEAADFVPRRSLWTMLRREWLLLLRTPIWMFNVIGGLLIPLVMFSVMLLSSGEALTELQSFLEGSVFVQNLMVMIIGGAALFMVGITSIAGSALSREGRFVWISKSVPVAAVVQLAAKGLHSLAFGFPIIIVLLIAAYLFTPLPAVLLVWAAVVSVLAAVLVTAWGLVVDMHRPNLDWTDPQRAMKSNLNPLFAVLAAGITYGLPAAALLRWAGSASPGLVSGLLVTWLAAASGLVVYYIWLRAEDCYLAL